VVGAGPAGSTVARKLAERGVRVVLIDKACFPRRKTCAGGVSPAASLHLPFGLEAVPGAPVQRAILSASGRRRVVSAVGSPLGWVVDRKDLDHALLRAAEGAGARLVEGLRVRRVTASEGWTIEGEGTKIRARFLVGADGVAGVVARSVGRRARALAAAIEATLTVSGDAWEELRNTVRFEFGGVDSGYAWVFARPGDLSVGVYSTRPVSGKGLRQSLDAFLSSDPVLRRARPEEVRCWWVPRGGGRHEDLHFVNGLLVGDAAGLADPLTGEGIGPALESAGLASDALLDLMEGRRPDLAHYSVAVDRSLRRRFRAARVCAAAAFAGRGAWVGRFLRSPWVGREWSRLARSEIGYPWAAWVLGGLRPPRARETGRSEG
jgi:geranylgeranyl reductase family protein